MTDNWRSIILKINYFESWALLLSLRHTTKKLSINKAQQNFNSNVISNFDLAMTTALTTTTTFTT